MFSDSAESALVMQYNNLGVVHHAMGKPNLACHHYQKALKADIAFQQNSRKDIGKSIISIIFVSKIQECIHLLII